MSPRRDEPRQSGIALIAVLMALTLLLLLALPFAVSMSRGADAATNDIEVRQAELLSASVRDLLLTEAAYGQSTYDPTPYHDERAEWPDRVPDVFPALRQDGRAKLGGEVIDLQRLVALDALTPLLLANLLGTTARLTEPLAADADAIQVDDASRLPEAGWVWCDHEVIRYGSKQGNSLRELERGQFLERYFRKPDDHSVDRGQLVLDYRCVLAVSWPFDGRTDASCRDRHPFGGPGELLEIERAGCGTFTPGEMDVLASTTTGLQEPTTAPVWGRPERVFRDLRPPFDRTLTVKSALHLGAGSTVRIRNLATGAKEYGLVMVAATVNGLTDLLLPSQFELTLLLPVQQEFPALDTVVEPLLPSPVNVNTADEAVLAALFAGVRRGRDVRAHDGDGQQRLREMTPISIAEARQLAAEIVALRSGEAATAQTLQGPFAGFREFAERLFKPRFEGSTSPTDSQRWIYLYRQLLTGRDSAVEMGTAPVCFVSGPRVHYRAAASVARSRAATGLAARHERSGIAVALPGLRLQSPWLTQEQLEEAFRLDQRAPFHNTAPVSLSAVGLEESGNDPSSRYVAHVVGMAFPTFGLGEPRFPSRDEAEATFGPAPSVAAPGGWAQEERHHESFTFELDPRGFDIGRRGPFKIRNTGPSDRGGTASTAGGGHQITHGYTTDGGVMDRCASSFWSEPDALATETLFDYSDGDPDRNRAVLLARDGNLLFEVFDEAGLDPDPSQSPAGVQRTAAQWRLPLADLGLPSRTPLHSSVTAYGNRPGDLAVAIDGIPRGEVAFRTFLTAALPVYDPRQSPAGPPGQSTRDPRYVTVQVESTAGFPQPQGVLRIGLELYEYTAINGNTFECTFRDSLGGRGARQHPTEHRPGIPTGADGKPTVDIEQLQQQGISLDLFPDHPVGSAVELYGYSALPSPNVEFYVGETTLVNPIGGFAVARGFVQNGRPIQLTGNGRTFDIGVGLDLGFSGDILLKAPPAAGELLTDVGNDPPDASAEVQDAFPISGGYALLVQWRFPFDPPLNVVAPAVDVGGLEVIRYARRQGNRLTGIQRAQRLPGDDSGIRPSIYDGNARMFVTDWALNSQQQGQPRPVSWDQFPQLLLYVVPISLPVMNPDALADPADTGTSEWLQFYPRGGPAEDTEWVRYDLIHDRTHVTRANRARWFTTWFALTQQNDFNRVQVGLGGTNNANNPWPTDAKEVWGTVTPTAGYIGYVPSLESTYPEIRAARGALAFRGDPFTGTSAHPQPNSSVLPCHRLQLLWGNYSALTARPGRNDRVALIQGSVASGTNRPPVEWHTIQWCCRRWSGDYTAQGQRPSELLGTDPFQLCAFQAAVAQRIVGPASNAPPQQDVRLMDRMVKFPSGELPAAWCEAVTIGGAVSGSAPIRGFVDEIDVTDHAAEDVAVDEEFTAAATRFTVNPFAAVEPQGLEFRGRDLTQDFPAGGGLVQIDQEILAYKSRANGVFEIAENGRGLLGTEPRDHDRGAFVHFLTQRQAAILTAAAQAASHELPLQALGALPRHYGTVLLGRTEMLHYAWVRLSGDLATLEMPRQFPPDGGDDGFAPRGLFRGRYGTSAAAAGAGEPVIAMPFRQWDRHVDRSDDPEQSYFQLSSREAPVFFRTLEWQEETTDPRVDVACLVRADGLAPWTADPEQERFLWAFTREAGAPAPAVLGVHAQQIEIRFVTLYARGAIDLVGYRAHGWKTAPRISHVRLEYEGERLVLQERTTAR